MKKQNKLRELNAKEMKAVAGGFGFTAQFYLGKRPGPG